MSAEPASSLEQAGPFQVAGRHARAVARRYSARTIAIVVCVELFALSTAAAFGLRSGIFVLVQVLAIVAMLALARYAEPLIDRWLQGARGEEKVARIIASLEQNGWRALHDVHLGRGNVDHILLGPAGLFTIETKSHRGRVRTSSIEPRMLKQAYAESKHVERITGLKVEPLLVFSDAYLTPAVCSRDGVTVLPVRVLAAHLKRRGAPIPVERVTATYMRLAKALAFGLDEAP